MTSATEYIGDEDIVRGACEFLSGIIGVQKRHVAALKAEVKRLKDRLAEELAKPKPDKGAIQTLTETIQIREKQLAADEAALQELRDSFSKNCGPPP